jgi:hypothetical protein
VDSLFAKVTQHSFALHGAQSTANSWRNLPRRDRSARVSTLEFIAIRCSRAARRLSLLRTPSRLRSTKHSAARGKRMTMTLPSARCSRASRRRQTPGPKRQSHDRTRTLAQSKSVADFARSVTRCSSRERSRSSVSAPGMTSAQFAPEGASPRLRRPQIPRNQGQPAG